MHGSSVPYQVAECPLGGLREHFQYELDEVRVVVVEPQQLHQVRHRRGEEPAKDLEWKESIHLSCLLWLKKCKGPYFYTERGGGGYPNANVVRDLVS